jgi:multidrug efflux system membrane fusion protein
VQTNTTGLLLIQRLDPIYADFTVTEADLPEVQRELAKGILQARVRIPADPPDRGRPGKLTFVDNSVQNATGTVNLRATVPNADHHFWPGQFVNVTLILATNKGGVDTGMRQDLQQLRDECFRFVDATEIDQSRRSNAIPARQAWQRQHCPSGPDQGVLGMLEVSVGVRQSKLAKASYRVARA